MSEFANMDNFFFRGLLNCRNNIKNTLLELKDHVEKYENSYWSCFPN